MEISYELTHKDFHGAVVAHRDGSLITKWGLRIWALFLIIFGILVAMMFQPPRIPLNGILFFLSLYLIFALWFLHALLVGPWWASKELYNKQPGAHGTKNLVVDPSGVHFRGGGTSSDVEWRNLIRWLENRNFFLLYFSPASFTILPKRSLTAEQINELRMLFAENIRAK